MSGLVPTLQDSLPVPPRGVPARAATAATISAMLRSLVMGVRKSWATLSNASLIPSDQALDSFQHPIKESAQLVQFITGLSDRDTGVHPSGVYHGLRGIDKITDRSQRAKREKCPSRQADQNHRYQDARYSIPEMLQNLISVLEVFADFQQIAVGEKAERNLQYVTAVLGWKILPFPFDGPVLVGLDIELLPEFRSTREYDLVAQSSMRTKKWVL